MTSYLGRRRHRGIHRRAVVRGLDEIAARLAEHPDLVILRVLDGPDDLGRSSFTADWWGSRPDLGAMGHRGQVFFADLEAHRQRWVEQGKTVEVSEASDGLGQLGEIRNG